MISHSRQDASRRALNIIWNAAGRYNFEPPFLAFRSDGTSDSYFNMMIGLADKWLGSSGLESFFRLYSGCREAAEFDELLWLGLENCLFEKEVRERPVLLRLRRERGEQFFRDQQQMSRQQMQLQSMRVYDQQQARWAFVTGRPLPLMNQRGKALAEALRFSGDLDSRGVLTEMSRILKEFFRFSAEEHAASSGGALGRKIQSLFRKLDTNRRLKPDVLLIRNGGALAETEDGIHLRWEDAGRAPADSSSRARDLAYIRSCFGECSLPEAVLHAMEQEVCSGHDAACRLWFTVSVAGDLHPGKEDEAGHLQSGKEDGAGAVPTDPKLAREAADTVRRAAAQYASNLHYYESNQLLISESIRKLSGELETVFSSMMKHLPEPSRTGSLNASKAYRAKLLNDPKIFLRDGETEENPCRVHILLDASQSRMHSQERIASEAYILAESLERAHVPVELTIFRSLRGFTVLNRIKSFSERDCRQAFRYFAGGWNRDALALKAMHYLIREQDLSSDHRHLLLVLTDASPSDAEPFSENGKPGSRLYEGIPAVEDAGLAAAALRRDGILTAAVFHGSSSHMENVSRIYGKEYVRIRNIGHLAAGFLDLIQMLLQEQGF